MEQILHNIAAAAGTLVPILYGLLIAAALDTLTGLWAAWNSGTLSGQYVAEFVRSHILQRIAPIFTAIIAGVAVGGTDTAVGAALIATAAAAGAAYLAEVVASITANISEGQAKTKGLPKR
jgi:hypothetical protein